jgi:SAM-dependent methyltransferase
MMERAQCPICGQPAEVIFSRPYQLPKLQTLIAGSPLAGSLSDKPYEVRYCSATDLYFQTWVMEEKELAGWYSPPVGDDFFMEEIGKQKLHWFGHMVTEILVFRQLCPEKVPVVLDFGCNWGKWASAALALGCEVFGVDVNQAAAGFCARRGVKIVSQEQLSQLRFDFINVDQVIEHLSEPLSVVRQLAGCLKPDGYIKLSTPGNPRLPGILRASQRSGDDAVLNARTLDSLLPLEHVNLFSRRSLVRLGELLDLQEHRQPLMKWLGAGQLWNIPRQFNMNLVVPFKRRRGHGTYIWLRRSTR